MQQILQPNSVDWRTSLSTYQLSALISLQQDFETELCTAEPSSQPISCLLLCVCVLKNFCSIYETPH